MLGFRKASDEWHMRQQIDGAVISEQATTSSGRGRYLGDFAECQAQRLWNTPARWKHSPDLFPLFKALLEPCKAPLKPIELGCIAAHAEDCLVDCHLTFTQPVHELVTHLQQVDHTACGGLIENLHCNNQDKKSS